MALLKKDVTVPVLPAEKVVSVPELGGEVIVRPLMLSDRLSMAQDNRGATAKDFTHIASLLAYAVVDDSREQLFTAAQWEVWGSVNTAAALRLWDCAWEISGLAPESAEKNSKAQNSSSQ